MTSTCLTESIFATRAHAELRWSDGHRYSAAVYIAAVTIDFFTVAFGYLNALDVIMQQPMEV